jgi:predicted CopG family antitoxin
MDTTIQISRELLETLKKRKLSEKESYENVIRDLIEDTMELSEETKKDIAEARAEVKIGKVHRWEDIKRELKLNV